MRNIRLTTVAVLCALCAMAVPLRAQATSRQLLNLQGRLTDNSGSCLTGTYSFTLGIFSVSSGGAALYTDTQAAVPVTSGIYNIELGAGTGGAIPASVFNNPDLYIEISINGETLTPRTHLTSAAFAFNADTLDGLDSTAFAPATGSANYAPSAGSGTYVAKTGDTMTGALDLPPNGLAVGTNQLVVSGGSVGIGTSSPSAGQKLEIVDSVNSSTAIVLDNPNTGSNAYSMLRLFSGAPQFDVSLQSIPPAWTSIPDLAGYGRLNVNNQGNGIILHTKSVSGGIQFWVGDTDSRAAAEKMRVTSSGNVGIGTSTPATTLDVNGSASVSGTLAVAGTVSAAAPTSGGHLVTKTFADTTYAPISGSPNYMGSAGGILTGSLSLPADGLTAGGTQLVLSGGSVGIGTSDLSGYGARIVGDTLIGGALFGSNGVIVEDLSANEEAVIGMALDSTSLYIAALDAVPGAGDQQWRIEKRERGSGNLVASFGTGGVVQENPSAGYDNAQAIAVDSTHIYVAGYDQSGTTRWRIERREKFTGALDAGFGAAGVVIMTAGTQDNVTSIAQDSSYIYVAGVDNAPGDAELRIEKRDKTTGALVVAFDGDGVVNSNPSGADDGRGLATSPAILVDGSSLFLATYDRVPGHPQWRIEKRDTSTGALVAAFDGDGVVSSDPGGSSIAYALAVDSSFLYVVGSDQVPGNDEWRIEKRDKVTGALVAAFNGTGVITENPSGSDDMAVAVAVDSMYLYLGGYDKTNGDAQMRLEKRDKTTGALIATFDGDGIAMSNPSGGNDHVTCLLIDSGYVYAGGFSDGFSPGKIRIEKRNIVTGQLDTITPGLFVNANGNVGIGTLTPALPLDVTGSVNVTGDLVLGGALTGGTWNGSTIGVASGGTGATSFSAGSVVFSNGTALTQDNANLYWDDTNSRLGIGTNNPQQVIDVFDSTNDVKIKIQSTNPAGVARVNLTPANDLTKAVNITALADGSMELNTYLQSPSELTLRSGKVGIGTTTPSQPLDVNGNANVAGALTVTGTVSAAAPTAAGHLVTRGYADATYAPVSGGVVSVYSILGDGIIPPVGYTYTGNYITAVGTDAWTAKAGLTTARWAPTAVEVDGPLRPLRCTIL
ncbi:MAG: hypothetical protein HYY93_00010 [Planctomycetes bacterium]|nr:hypothetical protein [Planctomycetota bacterium]